MGRLAEAAAEAGIFAIRLAEAPRRILARPTRALSGRRPGQSPVGADEHRLATAGSGDARGRQAAISVTEDEDEDEDDSA